MNKPDRYTVDTDGTRYGHYGTGTNGPFLTVSMGSAMKDPTREELEAFLRQLAPPLEADEFDVQEAIYWFANDWHGGQGSNLYSVLSTSEYSPGPCKSGLSEEDDGLSYYLYERLIDEYSHFEVEDGKIVAVRD
jgi:hypothetical protein